MRSRTTLLLLAFLLAGTGHAQREQRRPETVTTCSAPAVSCLFGTAPACAATCIEPWIASCAAGFCRFGFPVASRCRCTLC